MIFNSDDLWFQTTPTWHLRLLTLIPSYLLNPTTPSFCSSCLGKEERGPCDKVRLLNYTTLQNTFHPHKKSSCISAATMNHSENWERRKGRGWGKGRNSGREDKQRPFPPFSALPGHATPHESSWVLHTGKYLPPPSAWLLSGNEYCDFLWRPMHLALSTSQNIARIVEWLPHTGIMLSIVHLTSFKPLDPCR